MSELTFSKHALQRYCERCQDYDSMIDINVFLATRTEEVKERITKLIEYSELIYTGKSTTDWNNSVVDVYLNKSGWVVIVDHKKNNVITLYNITLGLDTELDRQYLDKISEKLIQLKDAEETALLGIAAQEQTYTDILNENRALENELRSQLKALEEQDAVYEDVIKSLHTSRTLAEKERRDFIAKILGKKVF